MKKTLCLLLSLALALRRGKRDGAERCARADGGRADPGADS